MSYPKKCDDCEQFGEWCFCEPAPVAEDSGDLYIPANWTTEDNPILDEAMVIARFTHDWRPCGTALEHRRKGTRHEYRLRSEEKS